MYDDLIKRLRECTVEQNGEKTLWHQAADAIEELQKPHCPFCGKEATIKREPLWRGSHGYVGCYEYIIQCDNPDCRCKMNLGQNDTIYRDDETARQNAINAWNRRANDV